jgi:hypothetical protein
MKCINIEINGIQYQFRGESEKEAFEGFKQSLSALKQEIKEKGIGTINLYNTSENVVPVKVNYLHQIKPLAAKTEPKVLPNVDLTPTQMSVEELMKQFGIVEQTNIQIKPIDFKEDTNTGYVERTKQNASADATIHLAVDFNTSGEKLTKKSVNEQRKAYLPIVTNSLEINQNIIDSIVGNLNAVNAKTLNIAGNGIYDMKQYTQEQVDKFTYQLLKAVTESSNLRNKIESIRTGGQTGFDESGAKAGQRLGIPTLILAPKGWKFRDINGKDISNEQQFKDRFKVQTVNQTNQTQQTETKQDVETQNSIEQLLNNSNFIDFVKKENIITGNPELDAKIKEIKSEIVSNKADDEVVVQGNAVEIKVPDIIEEVYNNVEEVEPVEHDGSVKEQSLTEFINTVKDTNLKAYLEVFNTTDKFPNVSIQFKTGIDSDGQFSLDNPDKIVVNANVDENKKAEIVLHELVHKATIIDYLLNRNSDSSIAFDKLFDEFIKSLDNVTYKKEYEANKINEIEDYRNALKEGKENDKIRVKAVAEFIAYGMSDKNFKKLLSSITSKTVAPNTKNRTLFQKLKAIVTDFLVSLDVLFGNSVINSVLDRLIDNVSFVLDREDYAVNGLAEEWKELVLNKNTPVAEKIPKYLNFGAKKTYNKYINNLNKVKGVMTDEQFKWFKHDVSYSNLVVNDSNIRELEQGDLIKVPKYEAVKDAKGNVTGFIPKITDGKPETRWEVVVKKYGNMIATIDEFGNTRTRIIKRDDEFEIKGIKKFIKPFNKTNIDLAKFYKENHTTFKDTKSTFIAGDGVKVMKGSTISYNTNFKMENGREYIGGGVVTANYGNMVEIVVAGKKGYFTKLIPTNTIRNVYFKRDDMAALMQKRKDNAGINFEATKLDIGGIGLKKTNIAFDKSTELTGEAYKTALNKHWNQLETGDMVVVKTESNGQVFQYPATIVAKTTAKGREGIMINHNKLLKFLSKEALENEKADVKILNYYDNPFEISDVYSTFTRNTRFKDKNKEDYKNFNRAYDIYDFNLTSDNEIANEKYKNINTKSMLNKAKQGDILNIEWIDKNEQQKKSNYEVLLEVTDEYYMTVKEATIDGENMFIKNKYYKNNKEHTDKIVGVGFTRDTDNYYDDMIELLPLLRSSYIQNEKLQERLGSRYSVSSDKKSITGKGNFSTSRPFIVTHFDSSAVTNGGSVMDKNGNLKDGVTVSNAEKFFASRGDVAMFKFENEKKEQVTAYGIIVHNRNNKMVIASNIKDTDNKEIDLTTMDDEKLTEVSSKLNSEEYNVTIYDKKYDDIKTVYFRNYKYSDEFVTKLKAAKAAEVGVVKLNYSNPKSTSIKAAKRFGLKESLDKYTARNVIKAKYDISDLEYAELDVRDEILKVYPLADLNELTDDDLHFLDVGALEQLEKTNWYSDLINRNSIPLLDLEFETEQDLYNYLEKRGVTSHKDLKNFIEKQRVKSTYNQLIEQGLLTMYC